MSVADGETLSSALVAYNAGQLQQSLDAEIASGADLGRKHWSVSDWSLTGSGGQGKDQITDRRRQRVGRGSFLWTSYGRFPRMNTKGPRAESYLFIAAQTRK